MFNNFPRKIQTLGRKVFHFTTNYGYHLADLGPRIKTPIWDPNLGAQFGTLIWDPDLGPRFGTPIWDPDLGPQFGTLIWDPNLGPRFLCSIGMPWVNALEHNLGPNMTPIWDPDLGP
jgi:hypothetical protein